MRRVVSGSGVGSSVDRTCCVPPSTVKCAPSILKPSAVTEIRYLPAGRLSSALLVVQVGLVALGDDRRHAGRPPDRRPLAGVGEVGIARAAGPGRTGRQLLSPLVGHRSGVTCVVDVDQPLVRRDGVALVHEAGPRVRPIGAVDLERDRYRLPVRRPQPLAKSGWPQRAPTSAAARRRPRCPSGPGAVFVHSCLRPPQSWSQQAGACSLQDGIGAQMNRTSCACHAVFHRDGIQRPS